MCIVVCLCVKQSLALFLSGPSGVGICCSNLGDVQRPPHPSACPLSVWSVMSYSLFFFFLQLNFYSEHSLPKKGWAVRSSDTWTWKCLQHPSFTWTLTCDHCPHAGVGGAAAFTCYVKCCITRSGQQVAIKLLGAVPTWMERFLFCFFVVFYLHQGLDSFQHIMNQWVDLNETLRK